VAVFADVAHWAIIVLLKIRVGHFDVSQLK
jgi:hypothetical protein